MIAVIINVDLKVSKGYRSIVHLLSELVDQSVNVLEGLVYLAKGTGTSDNDFA